MQIAAFSNKKSATKLLNKFSNIKKIKINKVFVNMRELYRVRVGPYKNLFEAERIYNYLIDKGMYGTKIILDDRNR